MTIIPIAFVLICFAYIFYRAKVEDKGRKLTKGEILEAQTDGWILWFWVIVFAIIIIGTILSSETI